MGFDVDLTGDYHTVVQPLGSPGKLRMHLLHEGFPGEYLLFRNDSAKIREGQLSSSFPSLPACSIRVLSTSVS
mgnify:CR=1 FL=1